MSEQVVGHYPRSNTLLIDLGWTGCSKQGPGEADPANPTVPTMS